MAASSLNRIVVEFPTAPQLKVDMRNYLLSYLYQKGPQLASFVVTSLIQLLCRVTKLGWYEADQHREIFEDACRFLQQGGNPSHTILGVKILAALVQEMNQPLPKRTITEHRKIAINFRDTALFKVGRGGAGRHRHGGLAAAPPTIPVPVP